jgi:enoyl-CoA hydratase
MNIIKEVNNRIWKLTINRESALNALNSEVMETLSAIIDEALVYSHEIKGMIITGAGPKAFVAGADISEFAGLSQNEGRSLSEKGQYLFDRIEKLPFPVIAAVNGFALGGGCELAMACHMRVAGKHARFGQPEVNLGLIPGYGGTQRLIRYIGRGKALELMLTGDMINADEAWRLGLVNHVVDSGTEVEFALSMISKIATKGPIAIEKIIKCVNSYFENNVGVFDIEADKFGILINTKDAKEGVDAFLNKRTPTFIGE